MYYILETCHRYPIGYLDTFLAMQGSTTILRVNTTKILLIPKRLDQLGICYESGSVKK